MFTLRLLTLNVRGLADPVTRRQLFYLLRIWPVDVCCLQEVHAPSSVSDRAQWTREWGKPAYWTQHTAILFKTHLGSPPKFDVLSDGRVLTTTFRYQGREFKLANLYVPAAYADRITFLDTLTSTHSLQLSSFDFLVGDWNMVPNPRLDRQSGAIRYDSTWPHMRPCLVSFFDAALSGAAERYFTFSTNTSAGPLHARLDHVFAHLRHEGFTMDTSIVPYARSDHSAVIVSFSDAPCSLPPFSRINTLILSSPRYQDTARTHFVPCTTSFLWDATKVLSRSHAQDHAVAASRRRSSDLLNLQRQLSAARTQAARRVGDPGRAAAVVRVCDQLDDFVTTATSRAQLRARVQWLEQGETCSHYFLSCFRFRPDSSTTSLLRDSNGFRFRLRQLAAITSLPTIVRCTRLRRLMPRPVLHFLIPSLSLRSLPRLLRFLFRLLPPTN